MLKQGTQETRLTAHGIGKGEKVETKHYEILSDKQLGRYLRFYRKKAGLTARQVAERLGYARSQSIYNIESGKSSIATKKLRDYLDLCGISYDEAFSEDFSMVDNPSRRKKPGSMLLQEMTETFRALDRENQRTVLKVAKLALEAQQAESKKAE